MAGRHAQRCELSSSDCDSVPPCPSEPDLPLASLPPAGRISTGLEILHPTGLRVLRSLERTPLPVSTPYLRRWTNRHARAINGAISQALGPERLRIAELFAGVGGLGSGLEAALDAVTILQAERVPERRTILSRHFPLAMQLSDVRELLHVAAPDDPDRLVVAGGFPCRGASRANLTAARGMAHKETGLWAVMAAVIGRWRPVLVVIENVASLRSRGLDVVVSDLDEAGYDALWSVLRASDCGAPHERARLFIIGRRRDAPLRTVSSRPPRQDWTPWGEPLPANDFDAPDQQARVRALGDAVVPIVAYSVGRTAARVLAGWWPDGGTRWTGGDLPMFGALRDGEIRGFASSPYSCAGLERPPRWVVVDERFESGGSLDTAIYPPAIGRIVWWDGVSDNVDVELPGGEVIPFPPEWVRESPWPTPVASDGRNRGARGQYDRNSPGLNALVQVDEWIAEDGMYGPQLLELFSGRGVGPGFAEWTMGFPRSWTALKSHAAARTEPATALVAADETSSDTAEVGDQLAQGTSFAETLR